MTEFPSDREWQWRHVWDIETQSKFSVMVRSVAVNKDTLAMHKEDSGYWHWLKKADLVFVYCSRSGQINDWWKLPLIVKPMIRSDAKMIAQWDDEFIWLFHPSWSWFSDIPDSRPPEQFFKETRVLDIADENWTVLERPLWEKYTSKPWRYIPLPHLWRYDINVKNADNLASLKGIFNMHERTIALIRHSSIMGRIEHSIDNVIFKSGISSTYFSTEWGPTLAPRTSVYIRVVPNSGRDLYMDILLKSCFIALDDAENYIGWSRFVMECALLYIPCIGSNFANKLFFPELYTPPKDYVRQMDLINQLVKDKDFYERIAREGRQRCLEHLDTDKLCREMLRIAREDLHVKELDIDIDKEIFISLLDILLPWYDVPRCPMRGSKVYDNLNRKSLSYDEWKAFWGKYERFINDYKVLSTLIRESLERKK